MLTIFDFGDHSLSCNAPSRRRNGPFRWTPTLGGPIKGQNNMSVNRKRLLRDVDLSRHHALRAETHTKWKTNQDVTIQHVPVISTEGRDLVRRVEMTILWAFVLSRICGNAPQMA